MLISFATHHRPLGRQTPQASQPVRGDCPLRRRGSTIIELVVSFGLLSTLLGVSLPLVVRQNRILASARHYRLALDELSNQVERIVALPPDDVAAAVTDLAPSAFAVKHLAGAKLNGVVAPADLGERVTLSITWDEPGREAAPLSLTAWLSPQSSEQSNDPNDADAATPSDADDDATNGETTDGDATEAAAGETP